MDLPPAGAIPVLGRRDHCQSLYGRLACTGQCALLTVMAMEMF